MTFFEWNPVLRHAVTLSKSNCTKGTAYTGPELHFSLSVLLMYGTNCLSQLILDRYLCSCAVSAVWIYLTTCIYNFNFMYYVYNGFYVFDFIAHCWATLSALCALLSSHIMTNKDDDDD